MACRSFQLTRRASRGGHSDPAALRLCRAPFLVRPPDRDEPVPAIVASGFGGTTAPAVRGRRGRQPSSHHLLCGLADYPLKAEIKDESDVRADLASGFARAAGSFNTFPHSCY